jgi:hypothetical protein
MMGAYVLTFFALDIEVTIPNVWFPDRLPGISDAGMRALAEDHRRSLSGFHGDDPHNITPQLPFGTPEKLRHVAIEITRAPWMWGEYAQTSFFHTMMLGYTATRVASPAEAHIMYLPFPYESYREGSLSPNHSGGIPDMPLRQEIVDAIRSLLLANPQLPAFFPAEGGVCSCCRQPPPGSHTCWPGYFDLTDLRQSGRLIVQPAWELPPFTPPGEQIPVPYVTQVHAVLPGSKQERSVRILFAGTIHGNKTCVAPCGPCGGEIWYHHWRHHFFSKGKCLPGCYTLRDKLLASMQQCARTGGSCVVVNDVSSPRKLFQLMANATFCLQPPGDTLGRKSFFDGLLLGCIPVVMRLDAPAVEQMPFSRIVPYEELVVVLPMEAIANGSLANPIESLFAMGIAEVRRRQRAIQRYARMLAFSATNSSEGGYNDLSRPDALAMTLAEVWHQASQGRKGVRVSV